MSKFIYLDSNDFSDLSVPDEQLSPENLSVLTALRKARTDGSALFFISAVHISEAVHASEQHKEAAVRRTALMRELCEDNVLLHPNGICKREIDKCLSDTISPRLTADELKSRGDEWFGFKSDETSLKTERDGALQELAKRLEQIPRRERRKRHLSLDLSKPSARQGLRDLIRAGTPQPKPPFPFSLIEQDVVIEWFLGQKSDAELRQMTLKIMRDPYAMFKYVVDATGHRETLYKITRDQGENWKRISEKLITDFTPIFRLAAELREELNLKMRVEQMFKNIKFNNTMIEMLAERTGQNLGDDTIDHILENCPAVSTYCAVMKSYLFSVLDSNYSRVKAGNFSLRASKVSDFSDIMHCIYAPYFDIFRCDSAFGAILKTISPIRSKIADKRSDILRML